MVVRYRILLPKPGTQPLRDKEGLRVYHPSLERHPYALRISTKGDPQMVTRTMVNDAVSDHAESASNERFAGWCAMGAAVTGLIYSLAFVVLKEPWLYGLAQLVGGLLTTAVLVAVYSRLRAIDQNFALWGLLLGLAGALGSAIHGGFDLANALNPPKADVLGDANVPFLVDPRGLLTFGVASIGT